MVLAVIKKRRSVRKYQSRLVEPEKIEEILRAGMYSPSARHIRGWQFIVVDDKMTIKKLADTKMYAQHLATASVVIAVVSEEYKYWLENASIVAHQMTLEVVNQGLSTCWTQIYDSQRLDGSSAEEYVKQVLKIPQKMRVLCLLGIGYPGEDLAEHDDTEFEKAKIHKNHW